MKVVEKMPLKKDIKNATKRIAAHVKYSNISGFFEIFIYTNIWLYFLFWVKIIFWL